MDPLTSELRRIPAALVLVLAAACIDSAEGPPTFAEDVSPILARHCARCHATGGVSTFRPYFDRYESVAQVSGLVARAVATRSMPPWGVDASGACGAYTQPAWLSPDEIATIVAWAEAGAPRGSGEPAPSDPPEAPRAVRGDATAAMARDYTPVIGDRLHRCFVIEPALVEDRYLTAFAVRPGNRRIVQHVSLFALDSADAEDAAVGLDEADTAAGYPCFGGPRVPDVRLVGTWTWGTGAVRFPSGTGIALRAERPLVLLVHYNALGDGFVPGADRTALDLELEADVTPAELFAVAAESLSLAPGREHVHAEARVQLEHDRVVHGLYPEMHVLGHELRLRAEREGACLGAVPHWELYGDMQLYWYAEPRFLAAGTALVVECSYDTTSRSETVHRGDGYYDEACAVHLYVTSQ